MFSGSFSAGDHRAATDWASSSSSEDGFPIHSSLRRGTYTWKGKSIEGVSDGENSLSHQKSCYYTNPQLKFSVDGEALQASIRMVQTMCEPVTSLASPPEEDSGGSHVACSAPGSQRSPGWLFRWVELWLAQAQAVHVNSQTSKSWFSGKNFKQRKLIQCCTLYTGFSKGFC